MRAGQECRRMDATEAINGRGRTLTGTTQIDNRASWAVALTALGIYTVSFGAPYITVVGLKSIAAELGSARSVPSLAFALAWFGSAAGGIAMALISSGTYLAGAIWSAPFERAIALFGWRDTMLIYAAFEIAVIVPAALIMFAPAPETAVPPPLPGAATTRWVLGLRPSV